MIEDDVSGVLVDLRTPTPDAVARAARAAASDGFGAVWFADHGASGESCGFVQAVWAARAVDDIGVGVWALPGADHPLRFAEEIGVLDRLADGRALIGLSRVGDEDWPWLRAVAVACRAEAVELTEPMRLPARDPENVWVPDGWTMQVSPQPTGTVRWWHDIAAGTLPPDILGGRYRMGGDADRAVLEVVA